MIVTEEDINALRSWLSGFNFRELPKFFSAHPHVILPCGFDEIRMQWFRMENPVWRNFYPELDGKQVMMPVYRQASSGVWSYIRRGGGSSSSSFSFTLAGLGIDSCLELEVNEVISACKQAIAQSVAGVFTITLPDIWRPPQTHPTVGLVDSTKALLLALRKEEKRLADLTWKDLEDIVAELLHARGMEINVTPRSADGGRDILARGELIPGEPTVLAVEVKHKGVVKLDDVRSRIYANREFPALMFATSGRFSAGVIREKWKPENFLRLFLKDGIALGQWIKEYHEQVQAPISQQASRADG